MIPYTVGVDIADQMKMTVFDLPVEHLRTDHDRLYAAIEKETRFGLDAAFRQPREHEVIDAD